METCPSTVWHLVFHYFDWCEGINVTFTLWTLLGRVYVQLLTYEDVSVCTTLTLSTRLRTNALLKTRSHTRAHVFLTKTYLYPFLSYETHVCITYFPITFTGENVSTQLLTYEAAFWTFCLDRHVCTQVLRLRVVFMRMFCLTRTRYSGWSERTMIHFQCKRHVSPYEAMGTRVRVRLRVRLSVRLRARVIEQSQVGNN